MPRWTEAQRLRASCRRMARQLRSEAYAAKRQKLICEICMAKAILMCQRRKHWLCGDCSWRLVCGCSAPPEASEK